MCGRNTVRESSHISFFCGGDPFWEVVRRPENTHEELTGLLEWPADLYPSFEWPLDLCLQSKITDIIFFQVPCGSMNILFASRIFLFIAGYRNLHTSGVFFSVICWSYLWTGISVTQSIGHKSCSLSCETTLLMLFCDRIESAKFLVTS